MKRLFSLALLVVGVFAFSLAYADPSPTFYTYNELRNAGGSKGQKVRILKRVRNSSQGANAGNIASNDAVVYDYNSADGVTVRLTANSADGCFAGIAATAILTMDTGITGVSSAVDDEGGKNWGWIVVSGPMTAKASAGGTNGNAVGDPLITSVDSGAVTSFIGRSPIATVNTSSNSRGFFLMSADGTSTAYNVFVRAI